MSDDPTPAEPMTPEVRAVLRAVEHWYNTGDDEDLSSAFEDYADSIGAIL